MADTKPLELEAEYLVRATLLHFGFEVLKPDSDKDGTDLIIARSLSVDERFARIQCKGRSVHRQAASVEVATAYATSKFAAFVYATQPGPFVPLVAMFTMGEMASGDIWKGGSRDGTDSYRLRIPKTPVGAMPPEVLRSYIFDESKVELLDTVIARGVTTPAGGCHTPDIFGREEYYRFTSNPKGDLAVLDKAGAVVPVAAARTSESSPHHSGDGGWVLRDETFGTERTITEPTGDGSGQGHDPITDTWKSK